MKKDFVAKRVVEEATSAIPGKNQEQDRQGRDVQAYESPDFGQIRVVMREGEPWFVAKDVCACLDVDSSNLSKTLDDDEKGVVYCTTPGGIQPMVVTSEPGLYSLILRSRKPDAKRFKRWVTHDVLPSIRKTGAYFRAGGEPAVSDVRKYFDRINMNGRTVSPDCFSVFHEIGPMGPELIHAEVPLDEHTMPDISAGREWSRHWVSSGLDEKYGQRSRYGHMFPPYYPQARKNPVQAWQYPLDALPEFRRWLYGFYIPIGFPKYLQRKVRNKEIPASVSAKAIEAFQTKAVEDDGDGDEELKSA